MYHYYKVVFFRCVAELVFLQLSSPAPEEEDDAADKKEENGEADCQDVSQSSRLAAFVFRF